MNFFLFRKNVPRLDLNSGPRPQSRTYTCSKPLGYGPAIENMWKLYYVITLYNLVNCTNNKLFYFISFYSGRKRRGSESALSDSSSDDYFYSMMWGCMDESSRCYSPLVMSECTAAMVLMNLSCSPTALKLKAARAAASSAHPALQAAALIQMNGDNSTYEHHQSDSTSKTHFTF